MFGASENKGFSMTFANGNTVSVQWGPGNYCDPTHPQGRNADYREPMRSGSWKATTAEVAAWDADGRWHRFDHDTVCGWMSANEVVEFMHFVANNTLNLNDTEETLTFEDDEV